MTYKMRSCAYVIDQQRYRWSMQLVQQGINTVYRKPTRAYAFLSDINGEVIGSLIMWSNDNWYW